MSNYILTLQPTTSSNDLSEKGDSKRPATNFTLNILSTASSILANGTSPDSTKEVKPSIKSWNLKGTITCNFLRHKGKEGQEIKDKKK